MTAVPADVRRLGEHKYHDTGAWRRSSDRQSERRRAGGSSGAGRPPVQKGLPPASMSWRVQKAKLKGYPKLSVGHLQGSLRGLLARCARERRIYWSPTT